MSGQIIIFGASGFASELSRLSQQCGYVIVNYVVDDGNSLVSEKLNGVLIVSESDISSLPSAKMSSVGFVVAIADSVIRKKIYEFSNKLELEPIKLIASQIDIHESVVLGKGVVICEGCLLTVNIKVGQGTIINMSCTIAHDVQIGEFVTVSPGVFISGNVHIGDSVFIGTGVHISNGSDSAPLVIGDGAIITAGSIVTRSVAAGAKVIAIPPKIF
ncbi:MAG: sugar O-acyltransferase (sialic acid O-acetyltransferase NeuD family) [Candidatus Azotimanducaceae bacterium]|jgi:sugar O-acyltransferase (sialic acid O-acetyltransferase NeuD family)